MPRKKFPLATKTPGVAEKVAPGEVAEESLPPPPQAVNSATAVTATNVVMAFMGWPGGGQRELTVCFGDERVESTSHLIGRGTDIYWERIYCAVSRYMTKLNTRLLLEFRAARKIAGTGSLPSTGLNCGNVAAIPR